MEDLAQLDYHAIANRYNFGSLKTGGDLQLTSSGDHKLVSNRLQIGDVQHNALHYLVVGWQFNAPMVRTMLDFIVKTETDRSDAEGELDRLALERAANRVPLERDQMMNRIHELNTIIAINAHSPAAYAGTVMVVLDNLLKREWSDLGKPNVYTGPTINKRSFGEVVRAGAANFRHSDEWAKYLAKPCDQHMKSITVIADVLGVPIAPGGRKHPFARNVCPEILRVLSEGSFERLMDRFFGFGRALAGL